MLLGVLHLALATALLVAVLTVVFYGSELRKALLSLARRAGLVAAPPERPLGPPLDRIAADLRRLRSEVTHPEAGRPMTRRTALIAAYDDALADACRAVGTPDTLTGLPPGTDRDAERLRVEYLLEEQGIPLRDVA